MSIGSSRRRSPYNKGDAYEDNIFIICQKRGILQPGFRRAGAGGGTDIIFVHGGKNYNLEVKRDLQADYGQKMLRWSRGRGWYWCVNDETTDFYTKIGVLDYLNSKGITPNKLRKPDSSLKSEDKREDLRNFEDTSFSIDSEALIKFYRDKDCYYIQIGRGFGFYHLAEDPAVLGTKRFQADFILRFRAKTIHSTPLWAYGFYAVLKVSKPPIVSQFNLEEGTSLQKFPPIKP